MLKAQVEKITPAKAEAMLKQNTGNFRNLDENRVRLYGDEMKSGNWTLNGETIKFNGKLLLDGQHRLAAIIKANVSVDVLVVRGVDADAREVDRGKPRSVGQWLNHQGVKNHNNIAATARLVLIHRKGMWGSTGKGLGPVKDSEIYDLVESDEDRFQASYRLSARLRFVMTPSTMSAVLFEGTVFHEHAEKSDLAMWFVKALQTGEQCDESDGVFHLRNRLLTQSKQSPLTGMMKRALLTIAWNKAVAGESCTAAALRVRLSGPQKQDMPSTIEAAEL